MRRGRLVVAAVGLVGAAACGSKPTAYLIVTVDARPAVHDARSIAVSLTNEGTTRMDTLVLDQRAFPVTFSVSTPGRTGDLAIAIDALDAGGLVVGHGSAMTSIAAPSTDVVLDSTDFVVNTDYLGDQVLVDDFEASGFQLAAQPDGTWTAAFHDACTQDHPCNVFARRFDATGKPVATQAGAGSGAFVVSARPSEDFTEPDPAVASSPAVTLALWSFEDPAPASTIGVACRALSPAGALAADQTALTDDTTATAVSVAPLASGDFIASWNAFPAVANSTNVVRGAIVKPDCTAPGGVQTVSTATGLTTLPQRSAAAGSGDHVLFTWVLDGNLHARLMSSAGVFETPDAVLIAQTAAHEVGHARIIAVNATGGFAVAVRWLAKAAVPGKIELFQVGAVGTVIGSPALITDQAGTGGDNDEAFGLAARADGTAMVAWHVCDANNACTVSGKIVRATGGDVTPVFAIPTTTGGSQERPSVSGLPDAFVVVWSDTSGKPPDTSGQAVRARIVYPP